METLQDVMGTLAALAKERKENEQSEIETIKISGVVDDEGIQWRLYGTKLWEALKNAPCGFFVLGGFTFDLKTLKELVGIEKDTVYTLRIEKDVTFNGTTHTRYSSPQKVETDAMLVVTFEGNRGIYRLRDKGEQVDSLEMVIGQDVETEKETAVAGLVCENGFTMSTSEIRAAIAGLKASEVVQFGDYAPLPVGALRKFASKKPLIHVLYNEQNNTAVLLGPNAGTAKSDDVDTVWFWEIVDADYGFYSVNRKVAILQNEMVATHIEKYVEGADYYEIEIGDVVTFTSEHETRTATIHEIMAKNRAKSVQSFTVTAVNVAIEPKTLLLPANIEYNEKQIAEQYLALLEVEKYRGLIPEAVYQKVKSDLTAVVENAPEQPETKNLHGDVMARRFFATRPNLTAKQAYKMASTIVKNWPDGEHVTKNGYVVAEGEREKFWKTAVQLIWEKIENGLLPVAFFEKAGDKVEINS